ncbi:MAG: hypothetical protein OXG52_10140 [bacterium]|nr:hypothetical protein [bacterium]
MRPSTAAPHEGAGNRQRANLSRHVVGAFTFDADNIPDHVAVNRFFAPRPTTPAPRATAGSQPTDPAPTTCTTTPNTPCQPTAG